MNSSQRPSTRTFRLHNIECATIDYALADSLKIELCSLTVGRYHPFFSEVFSSNQRVRMAIEAITDKLLIRLDKTYDRT